MPAIFRSSFSSLLLFLLAAVSLAQTTPPAGPPYRVEGDVTRPEKISGKPPLYTVEAREARVTGVVIMDTLIDEQGHVRDVKVVQGLPMGLDEAAVKAVQSWKFKPATLDGRPVPVYYTLTVNYTIEKDRAFGPLLAEFMRQDFEFSWLFTHQRFDEALALLEKREPGPGVHLARAYSLSYLGRLDEAWEEAQAYDGPEPYEIFQHVAFFALNAAAGTQDAKDRAGFLDVGLQAATRAMAAKEGDQKAMITKSQLLWEKAKLVNDAAARQALLDEADQLEKRASPPK